MDIKDLMQDFHKLTDEEFEQKLNKLIRENYRYKNLDNENKQVILEYVKKQKKRHRKDLGLSEDRFKDEMYDLYKKRLEINLTEEDFKDIKEILSELKK
jgi:hypothetical protein